MARLTILGAVIAALAAPAFGQGTREEAAADAQWLIETWTRLEAPLRTAHSVRYPANNLGTQGSYTEIRAEGMASLKVIEPLRAELPRVKERLDAINARWGSDDSDRVRNALAQALGKKKEELKPAGNAHYELTRWPRDAQASLKKASDHLVQQVDEYMGRNPWVRYGECRANLELAQGFAPSDALAARIAGWDQEVARHKAANAAKLDAEPFPGHLKNWNGSGDPDVLARTAVEFLRAPADYSGTVWLYDHQGPWTFHRAALRYQWRAEETVAGTVTQWSLFVLVAISDREMEADGVAALILFKMSCAQHAQQASGWVDAHWEEGDREKGRTYVRLAKVAGEAPAGAAAAEPPAAGEPAPAAGTAPAPAGAASPEPAAESGSWLGTIVCVLSAFLLVGLAAAAVGAAFWLRSRAGQPGAPPPTA